MNPNRRSLIRHHQDVYHTGHAWHYTALWQYGDERLRVDIERDNHDFQSYVRALVWSRPKMEWSPIAQIHISQAECRRISHASEGITVEHFERDERTLLDRALMVIGEHPNQTGGDDRRAERTMASTRANHTPEPWWIDDHGFVAAGGGDNYVTVASTHMRPTAEAGEEQDANACRIAAAVNACKGISTANLEDATPRGLRSLLEGAIETAEAEGLHDAWWYAEARALIANA